MCGSVRGGAMNASNAQVVPFSPTRISVKDFGPIKKAEGAVKLVLPLLLLP
jgi:hypothetical protein